MKLHNFFTPFSSIFFLNSFFAGVLIFLVLFLNYSVLIGAFLGIFFSLIFAKFINQKDEFLSKGFYIYNSLLVGMGVGYVFLPSALSIILIAVGSIFSFLLSYQLNKLFETYKIPILSLPFSIVTIFIYLASLKYSSLSTSIINNATLFDIDMPIFISGFLKSLGTIIFLPNNLAGILLVLILGFFSRILVFLAIFGFYLGVFFNSLLVSSFSQAILNPYSFNYILTAISLGAVFLIPSLRSFVLASIGVLMSVILSDAVEILFTYYSIPVFTIPFNIVVISFIFILSTIGYKEFNYNIKPTPEESLSSFLDTNFRFSNKINIFLPFFGIWKVYQGFNDIWTHKGEYRYAYDFVKEKENKTYCNEGLYLEDYYCFNEPIVSPINGVVVDLRDDLVDNYIGVVDKLNNWGNYIIIKSDYFFVKICHLRQYSINVKIGDILRVGQIIAKCGNSGYSPEPHIHIQVQYNQLLGGFTQDFCFNKYFYNNKLVFYKNPKKNDIIEAITLNKGLFSRFSFILDDSFEYNLYKNGKFIEKIKFVVKMNDNGEFYFSYKNDKLYFYYTDSEFYFYNYIGNSYLKYLFILFPRIAFVTKEYSFDDYLPLDLVYNKFYSNTLKILSIFNKNYYQYKVSYSFSNNTLLSKYGYVKLNYQEKGFLEICYKDIVLRKI